MLDFAKELKKQRLKKKLTLQQLSKLTGISNQALSMYELGKMQPKFNKAQEILKVFGVNIKT
jgi:transcriptional regulator with XRE-family HTH domain